MYLFDSTFCQSNLLSEQSVAVDNSAVYLIGFVMASSDKGLLFFFFIDCNDLLL
jgi:hypothetical protein